MKKAALRLNSFARLAALAAFAACLGIASVASPALAVPHAGDDAPAFVLPGAHGGTVALARLRGKPFYLNFFASWCSPCNDEAPDISRLYRKYRARGLTIVGVDELEDASKATGFAAKYRWPFAVALDNDGNMARDYGVIAMPVHVFVDRRGKISTYRLGIMQPAEIEDAIRKIL